jgi:hypothetical protein
VSQHLSKWLTKPKPDDDEKDDGLNENERRALATMQREAKRAGATLASDGKGGLPPSLVLGVMRRDKYTCKRCGGKKDLVVHHKGHLDNPKSMWLAKMGKKNTPVNIVTICEDCHDGVHEEDRVDSSQVTPEGDEERKE